MKKLASLGISTILMLLLVTPVYAQTDTPEATEEPTRLERRQQERQEQVDTRLDRSRERQQNRSDLLEQRQDERETRQNERQSDRCERVESRATHLLEIYVTNSNRILGRLGIVEQRVQNTVNELADQGLNTSQLQTALDTFSGYSTTASEEIDLGIADLERAIDQVCDDDSFNAGEIISSANGHFRAAREAVKDAVNVVRTEIIPIVKRIISEDTA